MIHCACQIDFISSSNRDDRQREPDVSKERKKRRKKNSALVVAHLREREEEKKKKSEAFRGERERKERTGCYLLRSVTSRSGAPLNIFLLSRPFSSLWLIYTSARIMNSESLERVTPIYRSSQVRKRERDAYSNIYIYHTYTHVVQ